MIIKKPLPDSWFHYQQGEYPSDYMTDPLILNLIDGSSKKKKNLVYFKDLILLNILLNIFFFFFTTNLNQRNL